MNRIFRASRLSLLAAQNYWSLPPVQGLSFRALIPAVNRVATYRSMSTAQKGVLNPRTLREASDHGALFERQIFDVIDPQATVFTTTHEEEPCLTAFERMVACNDGSLLVFKKSAMDYDTWCKGSERRYLTCPVSQVAGIVGDRDLLKKVLLQGQSPSIPVCQIMSNVVVTIKESATMLEVLDSMVAHGVRQMPVTDDAEENILAVLSVYDVLSFLGTKEHQKLNAVTQPREEYDDVAE